MNSPLFKDDVLDALAKNANVAQFVSFAPGENPEQRHSRVFGYSENHQFPSVRDALQALMDSSPERSINVRSFLPGQPQGHEFIYGIKNVDVAVEHVKRLAANSFYTIVNETIDVNDGGVSGVFQGGVVEFAPGVVPRFIEKNSQTPVPALPFDFAINLLTTVYSFTPNLDGDLHKRVEFSIHPEKRGWHNTNTIIWEEETVSPESFPPFFVWPNAFSMLLGDKAYGLLVGHLLGAPVPKTTVYLRNKLIAPFSFGSDTGGETVWTRTCPSVPVPGRYLTEHAELDPFGVMDAEDPERQILASCLSQQNVPAKFSGTVLTTVDGNLVMEGVAGSGDDYMLGNTSPVVLPESVQNDLRKLRASLDALRQPVSFEWAHDGLKAWLLQLHLGSVNSSNRTIVPGEASEFVKFEVSQGLEMLRQLVNDFPQDGRGIVVVGNIGLGSHIADVLRKANIPSYIEIPPSN